jgi:hypothetical protein
MGLMSVACPDALERPYHPVFAAEDLLNPVDKEIAPLLGGKEGPLSPHLHLQLDPEILVPEDGTVLLGQIYAGAICPRWFAHKATE